MPTIGPDIPAHLLNRNRTDEEDHAIDSNPAVGPQIPQALLNQTQDDEEEDDDYVPALPPDMVATRSVGPSTSKPSTSKTVEVPVPPPIHSSYHSRHSSDDEDDVGPKPLPPGMRHEETDAVREFMEKEERRRKELEVRKCNLVCRYLTWNSRYQEAGKPKALKRDEWMLVPPSSSDLLGSTSSYPFSRHMSYRITDLDPSRLTKARQFSRSSAPLKQADNSLWTETPAERQQRLADEVSGKKRRAVNAEPVEEAEDGKKKRRMDESIRRGVDEYTVGSLPFLPITAYWVTY
jgi:Protein of unknown function (DUF3752)